MVKRKYTNYKPKILIAPQRDYRKIINLMESDNGVVDGFIRVTDTDDQKVLEQLKIAWKMK
ncbi:hypothetical protein A7K93_09015 [Candidatus Methylacidiphilum fumarolicum]|nr:hypothetical protein A7K73_06225 [Candidatus Methylacidiphilum fumarolicum]TFE72224.1 hypothetical protein A7K72_09275 [Candidatus Methylacidiphilum fumarolicum]TFE72365.1 hypothetical protein A7K93_09015 [Candidatus Methylacidiphilum fumarolicum]TFE76977.1 hypothetical protein A7D33_07140 [Candidatus Methylacidiphilum fumarolicum]